MINKIIITICISFLCLHSNASEFEQCLDYFPNQKIPKIEIKRTPQRLRDLCFDSFAVMHSGESKTPIFTVEKLNRARIQDARDENRTNLFYPEARLPIADRAQLEDYKNSSYDRGHMAPAADMPTPTAMAQSFSLANMTPQSPDNNRGIWAKAVEKSVRQYAMRATGNIFVFTGPVFKNGSNDTIGRGKVWVPTHIYKLVYDAATGKAYAYWVENQNNARMNAPISYQELVRRTGIEFLPGIAITDQSEAVEQGGQVPALRTTSAPVPVADRTCHTGPRGGTYTLTPSGRKNYGGC